MAVRWGKAAAALLGVACVVASAGSAGGATSAPGGSGRGAASSSLASAGAVRARTASAAANSWPGAPIDPAVYDTCANLNDYTPIGPAPVSAYLAGWSDTSKLGQALPVGYPAPALAVNPPNSGVWQGGVTIDGVAYECSYGQLQLDDHGARQLPPVTASFTGFGFMPMTATAYLTQYGTAPITLVFYANETTGTYSVVTSTAMTLRIGNVKVNGTTLNVGSDCRTTGPLTSPDSPVTSGELVLSGGDTPGDPEPLDTVAQGGAMVGLATIPAFTGCVTPQGENLAPLLDATISGPGNVIKIDQGPLCGSVGSNNTEYDPCVAGTNMARYAPLWTISHGGPYTASGSLSYSFKPGTGAKNPPYKISCNSGVAGDIPDMLGAPRGATGTIGWTGGDCTGASNGVPDGTTWTVTQRATPSLDLYADVGGIEYGDIWNFSLLLTGSGVATSSGTCTLQISGSMPVTYTDSTSALATIATNQSLAPVTDCPKFPRVLAPALTFSYPLSSRVQITSP